MVNKREMTEFERCDSVTKPSEEEIITDMLVKEEQDTKIGSNHEVNCQGEEDQFEYEVESIHKVGFNAEGERVFHVKWKGYAYGDQPEVRECDIVSDNRSLFDSFLKKQGVPVDVAEHYKVWKKDQGSNPSKRGKRKAKVKDVKEEDLESKPPKRKKVDKPAAPKGSWIDRLPQPAAPPLALNAEDETATATATADEAEARKDIVSKGKGKKKGKKETKSKKASDGRNQLVNDDILYVFHQLLQKFQDWKPTPPPQDKDRSNLQGMEVSKDGNTTHYGENRYNYLELCTGIKTKNRYGWGEHIRGAFTGAFLREIFTWIQNGASGPVKNLPQCDLFQWDIILEAWWGIKEIRPSWEDVRVARGLAKGMNETIRLKSSNVRKALVIELKKAVQAARKASKDK